MSTALEPLAAGQRMMRAEFHARYRAMPSGTTFELIAGKVHMASPLGRGHGRVGFHLSGWLFSYACRTPGVEGLDNASVALDGRNEVQPDLTLRVDPALGGRSRDEGGIVHGPPELVVEVADSSIAVDLGPKLVAYESAGCLEYLVVSLQPLDVHWHARTPSGKLRRIEPDVDGVFRSAAFPGLWLDAEALLSADLPALMAALDRGLASPDHAAFAGRLAAFEARRDRGDDA